MSEKRARNSILMMRHYPDQVSDSSSVTNFCTCFSDISLEGKQLWHHKMTAVYLSYYTVVILLLSFCFALAADPHFFLVLHSFLSRPCPVRSVLHTDSYCGSCYHIAYNCTCSSWHFYCIIHEEWWWNLEGMNLEIFNIKVNQVLKFHVPLQLQKACLK